MCVVTRRLGPVQPGSSDLTPFTFRGYQLHRWRGRSRHPVHRVVWRRRPRRGDLAGRVKDPLAAMPESSAWPILSKAASDDSPCMRKIISGSGCEEPPRDPLLILEDCFA